MSRPVLPVLRRICCMCRLHVRPMHNGLVPLVPMMSVIGSNNPLQLRFKGHQTKTQERSPVDEDEEESSDDEELDLGDDGGAKDYKERAMIVSNARLDAVAKVAFGLPRSEIPLMAAKGLFRINNEVVWSKGKQLAYGDVLDYFVGHYPDNPRLSTIQRCVIKKVTVTQSKTKVEVLARIWKQMIVDDFPRGL